MDKSFDQQFVNRLLVDHAGYKFWAIDISPENVVGTPVVFAPGWNESFELRRDCIKTLFDSGRRVVSLEHSPVFKKQLSNDNLPAVESSKADSLLLLLESVSIDSADLVTHSEGAINAAIAASRKPNLFRRIVMVTPAGLSGHDNVLRIGAGFVQHLMLRNEPVDTLRMIRQIMGHTAPTNSRVGMFASAQLAWQEGEAMAHFDLLPLLLRLEKQGIEVKSILGMDDLVFPLNKVLGHLKTGGVSPNFGLTEVEIVPGGHEMYTRPPHRMHEVIKFLD